MAIRFHFLLMITLLAVPTRTAVAAGHDEILVAAQKATGFTHHIKEPLRITAQAEVTVSDGLAYRTLTSYQARQIAIFQREYEDRIVTLGVDGKDVWAVDDGTVRDLDERNAAFVFGHQFHARILGFADLFSDHRALGEEGLPADCNCRGIKVKAGADEILTMYFNRASDLPQGMVSRFEDGTEISFTFSDWQSVDNILLPHTVRIDDRNRVFDYRFEEIAFNADMHSALRPAFDELNDEQKLRRLHRITMEAHLDGDHNAMTKTIVEPYTTVNRGEISKIDREAFAGRFDWIFSTRRYLEYDDLVQPIVKVSADGSLGWVIVQVGAEGVLHATGDSPERPFTFISGWIELYEKQAGEWRMTGNVSNFKPEG